MDAMGFGMGCCCLQITFQACSVEEARRVYDALVPVSSVMVGPFPPVSYHGIDPPLARLDSRQPILAWIYSGCGLSLECHLWRRRRQERRRARSQGLSSSSLSSPRLTHQQPLSKAKFRIPKSRYSSVDAYLSRDSRNRPEYNDLDPPYDKDVYDRLLQNGPCSPCPSPHH